MFKSIIKLLKALNSNRHPGEIAHAVCCGILLGLMPKTNLTWYVITFIFLYLRINKVTLTLVTTAVSFLAPSFDMLFDSLGYTVLTCESLVPYFAKMVTVPFLSFLKLNNTIVMGSLVSGLVLYIPVYAASRLLIFLWRRFCVPVLRKTKFIQMLSKLPVVMKIKELA